ncbi:MAG: D-alanyl-D-alanine carboxypeptidase family protein [Actinomycetota bacterium]|nr:D-alanyl-D-alanine carboxypeptidase family protein [Actinomycetota bacterium]
MINRNSLISRRIKLRIYRIFLLSLIFFLLNFLLILFNPGNIYSSPYTARYDEDIKITAESAVIIDCDTGEILWEKNSSSQMYPASLTKMLSSIVAIENIDNLEEIVEIPKNASGSNHSSFTFRTGDRISLIDLLKAALISSHNNAAIALGEYVSGDLEEFIELMNKKAKEIGANDSFFENPNGLDDKFPGHMSTAEDMAIVASYCMKNELFSEIVNTEKDTIKIDEREIEITNTNDLLGYNYIKGVKTGYTSNAGFCMAIYSEKKDLNLITVVLNSASSGARESDIYGLIDWAYDNLEYVKIVDSEEPVSSMEVGGSTRLDVDIYPERDYVSLLNKNSDELNVENNIDEDISLPLEKNEILGSANIIVNGEKIEEVGLVSHESIGDGFIHQELSTSGYRQTLFIIILLMVFYFLIIITIIVKNLLPKRFF